MTWCQQWGWEWIQNLGPSTDMENWGTQVLISGPAAFLQWLPNSGKAQIPAELRKHLWCSICPQLPHTGLPRTPARPCSIHKPQKPEGAPTSLPRKAPLYPIFSEAARDELPCGASHTILFSLDEAACDSAAAAAEIFDNYLMIRTLPPKVVNLLASSTETVKFKTVSLAFRATALAIKTEDNWRKTDASLIPVEKDALFCKNMAVRAVV